MICDCQGMHPEETDYSSAQSTARAKLKDLTKSLFFVPPCFFGTKKPFVHGEDVEGASRLVDLNDSRPSLLAN